MTPSLRGVLHAPPRGVALVEFGLAFPFLVLLIVGLVDFGLGFYTGLQVQGAATAGAEYASVNGFDPSCYTTPSSCPIAVAVQSATNLGTMVQLTSGFPKEVCGCPSGTDITSETPTTTGVCPTSPTCTGGTAQSLYAKVSAFVTYSPLLPYPGIGSSIDLTAVAYRRVL